MIRSAALPLILASLAAACGRGDAVRTASAAPAESSAAAAPSPSTGAPAAVANTPPPRCDAGNGGLQLPAGFCATVFSETGAHPRHIAVAPNGDVYVGLAGGRSGGAAVMALRDTDGDGHADQKQTFGNRPGTGIAVSGGWLYHAPDDGVVRWRLAPGQLVPTGDPEVIVRGLPTGGHTAKNIALDGRGGLFVNLGSRTNACQEADRQAGSRGRNPCPELATRAGIWRFDAARANQGPADGARWATGIRNGMGLAFAPGGQLWATQHGRDQLHDSWPAMFDDRKSAENPGEEFFSVSRGDDFGWPYCYWDVDLHRLVLAPEYGGDGRAAGQCAQKRPAAVAFPGHWAPMSLLFYTGTQFPAKYRGGAFIAFHGSWNRAPLPQAGYRVAFVPFSGGRPSTAFETFADGFTGGNAESPAHRPMGLAQAPDGSIYVTDDANGRIWRIYWRGGR